MQNTLLGLGIALILALVTALAGPFFVDWTHYRAGFESEASRIAGLPVRIGGAIDVRLLPTPTIVLHDVEAGSRAAPVFGAQVARAELSLGSLVKGEIRAALLTLEAPDISLGLDASGQIVARNASPGVDLNAISIDRIAVTAGTLALEDATSGARTSLDKIAFNGEIRSLAGAVRGDGSFVSMGRTYNYRVATSRSPEGLRLHFNLDPRDRPLAFETDGLVTLDKGTPRYEGTLSLARPAGVQLADGKTVASDPWRLTGKVKGDARSALFEQVELQYGPEERVLRLAGTAEMKFGKNPDFNGVLSARQIDLDRAMASPDQAGRLPLAALRGLTESLGEFGQPPMPVRLSVGIDSVTLGGSILQSVRSDLRFAGDGWGVDRLELRAPGYTQVVLSGKIGGLAQSAEFSGYVAVDSADPRALLAWLEGFERSRAAIAPLKIRGSVTASKERFAVDRVRAESDRKAFEGKLAYTYARNNQSAKVDAVLRANEFDVDGAIAFFNAAFSASPMSRPGDIALAVDFGRMTYAGIEASSAKADIRFDANGLKIEKLSISDFGGATINASGQIDISASPPRGAISMSLAAQKTDGIAALLRRIAPETADSLIRQAQRLSPAAIDASVTMNPQQGGSATGKLTLDGRLGGLRISLGGEASGPMEKLAESNLRIIAQLNSEDGALLTTLGLDRFFGKGKRPTGLTLGVNGAANGDLRVESKLTGEGLEGSVSGTLRLALAPWAKLAVSVAAADLPTLRRDPSPLPLTLKTNLELNNGVVAFTDVIGRVGSSPVRGQVAFDNAGRLNGKIAAESMDIPALVALMSGTPPTAKPGTWATQTFAASPFADLRGEVELEATKAVVVSTVQAQKLRGKVVFMSSGVAFEDIAGTIGNGLFLAKAKFSSGTGGVTLQGSAKLDHADAGTAVRIDDKKPIMGKISGQVEFEGTGSTPAALIAALRGSGTVSLESGQIAGIDAKAIDVAMRAVERGTPIAANRIGEITSRVMETGTYSFAKVSAPIEVAAGRARLGNISALPQTNRLGIAGSFDLVDETLDARFTLTGLQATGESSSQKPEVSMALKGPVASPRRTLDVSPLVGWLTLQAVDREAKRLEAEEQEARRREKINTEIEERLRRSMAPPPAPADSETQQIGKTASPEMRQTGAPLGRTPPVIETAPSAPVER